MKVVLINICLCIERIYLERYIISNNDCFWVGRVEDRSDKDIYFLLNIFLNYFNVFIISVLYLIKNK